MQNKEIHSLIEKLDTQSDKKAEAIIKKLSKVGPVTCPHELVQAQSDWINSWGAGQDPQSS